MFRSLLLCALGCWLVLAGGRLPAAAQRAPRPTKAPPAPAAPARPTPPPYRQRALKGRVTRHLRVRADGTPSFPNVNRIAFFEDKKALKAIQKAERRHHYAEAKELLTNYVGQFGIENFYRNTDMLWHLGQLLQRDSTQRAVAGIGEGVFPARPQAPPHRHHGKIQLYYDSLEAKDEPNYTCP